MEAVGTAGRILAQTPGSPPGGAMTIRLAWEPSKDLSVMGYRIYYGTQSGKYTHTVRVTGRLTAEAVVENLEEGKTYFFAVTSYDAKGKESAYSAEVTNSPKKIPPSKAVARNPEGKILPVR
jgi:fibronectin type 3 domain-containing protein